MSNGRESNFSARNWGQDYRDNDNRYHQNNRQGNRSQLDGNRSPSSGSNRQNDRVRYDHTNDRQDHRAPDRGYPAQMLRSSNSFAEDRQRQSDVAPRQNAYQSGDGRHFHQRQMDFRQEEQRQGDRMMFDHTNDHRRRDQRLSPERGHRSQGWRGPSQNDYQDGHREMDFRQEDRNQEDRVRFDHTNDQRDHRAPDRGHPAQMLRSSNSIAEDGQRRSEAAPRQNGYQRGDGRHFHQRQMDFRQEDRHQGDRMPFDRNRSRSPGFDRQNNRVRYDHTNDRRDQRASPERGYPAQMLRSSNSFVEDRQRRSGSAPRENAYQSGDGRHYHQRQMDFRQEEHRQEDRRPVDRNLFPSPRFDYQNNRMPFNYSNDQQDRRVSPDRGYPAQMLRSSNDRQRQSDVAPRQNDTQNGDGRYDYGNYHYHRQFRHEDRHQGDRSPFDRDRSRFPVAVFDHQNNRMRYDHTNDQQDHRAPDRGYPAQMLRSSYADDRQRQNGDGRYDYGRYDHHQGDRNGYKPWNPHDPRTWIESVWGAALHRERRRQDAPRHSPEPWRWGRYNGSGGYEGSTNTNGGDERWRPQGQDHHHQDRTSQMIRKNKSWRPSNEQAEVYKGNPYFFSPDLEVFEWEMRQKLQKLQKKMIPRDEPQRQVPPKEKPLPVMRWGYELESSSDDEIPQPIVEDATLTDYLSDDQFKMLLVGNQENSTKEWDCDFVDENNLEETIKKVLQLQKMDKDFQSSSGAPDLQAQDDSAPAAPVEEPTAFLLLLQAMRLRFNEEQEDEDRLQKLNDSFVESLECFKRLEMFRFVNNRTEELFKEKPEGFNTGEIAARIRRILENTSNGNAEFLAYEIAALLNMFELRTNGLTITEHLQEKMERKSGEKK